MKNFLKKQWPLIALALVLLVAVFYLVRSGRETAENGIVRDLMSGEGVKLQDIHYTQDDPDARIKWVLDAREVRFSQDRRTIFFHGFRLSMTPRDRPWFRLNGKEGRYSRDTGDMQLWGDLKGTSGNGYTILTQRMIINEKRGVVRTDQPVRIMGPLFSVDGRGLTADMKTERLKVLSHVTTTIHKGSFVR